MISMFIGRKCRGKSFIKGSFQEFDNGVFLGFGINYEEFDTGQAQYTTAIVELEDGQVIVTVPENIQFINKKRIIPEKPLADAVGVSELPDGEMPSEDKKDAGRDNEGAREASQSGKRTKRRKVDIAKIMALKKAGWDNAKIGDEMGIKPSYVAVLACKYKNSVNKQKGNAEKDLDVMENDT